MSLLNRLIGVGEGIGSFLLFEGVCSIYDGKTPWYIGLTYASVHIPLTIDAVSRVFLGESCCKLSANKNVSEDIEFS